MKRIVYLVLSVAFLPSCVTEQPANPQMVEKLGRQCETYGFKPGTPEYSACILQLDQNRIAQNRENRQRFGAALQEAARRNVNCTSRPIGNTVYTNCY